MSFLLSSEMYARRADGIEMSVGSSENRRVDTESSGCNDLRVNHMFAWCQSDGISSTSPSTTTKREVMPTREIPDGSGLGRRQSVVSMTRTSVASSIAFAGVDG